MPNKMERFTGRAKHVLSLAQETAEEFNHNQIGTEHLLLGLIREEKGIAALVLHDLGVEQAKVIELIAELTHGAPHTANTELDLSPGTKKMLELAVDEARRMGHHYIGTEHLLLALVRQSDGVAIDVLKRLGVSPEEVRRQTRRVLQEAPVQPQSAVRQPESGNITRTHISGQTFSPYETPSLKIMNAAITKILDMIEAGKLNTAQGAELLSALQPWFSTSLAEKSLLIAQFNQPENIQNRHLRVVVSNIDTNDIRFEMTIPLQDALNSVEAILGAVSAQFIGRLWTEDVDTTNRIEVYIDEDDAPPTAESGDSDAQ